MPIVFLNRIVGYRHAQTCTFSNILCGKERFKDLFLRLIVHPRAIVPDVDVNILFIRCGGNDDLAARCISKLLARHKHHLK